MALTLIKTRQNGDVIWREQAVTSVAYRKVTASLDVFRICLPVDWTHSKHALFQITQDVHWVMHF